MTPLRVSFALCAGLLACASTVLALSPPEVFERASKSVVIIEADQGAGKRALGSGVVVTTVWIATNCHVIGLASLVTIRRGDHTLTARLGPRDESSDLCLLHSSDLNSFPGLGVARRLSGPLKPGSRVFAIGSPRGLELSISEGLVSAVRDDGSRRLIQTSTSISPGSSGGGLFDDEGRLIGITTLFLTGAQNLNFAVPVDRVDTLLARAARERNAATTGRPTTGPAELLYDPFAEERKAGKSARSPGSPPTDSPRATTDVMRAYETASRFIHDDTRADLIALVTRANALSEQSRWNDLRDLALRAIERWPWYAQAWQMLGIAYLRLGDYGYAEGALKEAQRLKPDDEWIAWLLRSARAGRGRATGAPVQ